MLLDQGAPWEDCHPEGWKPLPWGQPGCPASVLWGHRPVLAPRSLGLGRPWDRHPLPSRRPIPADPAG